MRQFAALDLVSADDEVAARPRHDPQEARLLLRELVAGGELAADEVLDEAVDSVLLAGLLALQGVRTASGPSTAAELCLSAVSHITLAVVLASVDLD
ncbi:hypothetical protein [Streptomyces sp. NBC_00893]|uniref:hypothetical protein n=1 Tax=Streptomyces sp. NBC_00893 TaxID=2975862 RepID=UPI0022587346|nr:hypothetical protein [Streptomyces sp. NBC_00893]MCX4850365.1 hypothetical protein [Streptomyces sp. NBC_00893]